MADRPYYLHDHCDECVFLGNYEWSGQYYDLYFCKQGRLWPTVIARFSSDTPDYISGLDVAKAIDKNPVDSNERNHPLVEAMRRGKTRGLISRKDTRDL